MKKLITLFLLHSTICGVALNEIIIKDAALQPDQKTVSVGNVLIHNVRQVLLTRYTSLGITDTAFGLDGIVTTSLNNGIQANNVILQPDGKILIAGSTNTSSTTELFIARYLTNGDLDTSFGPSSTGIVTTLIGDASSATGLALQSDDKIVVSGTTIESGNVKFAIARYINDGINDGDLDPSFGTSGVTATMIGSHAQANDLIIQSDDKAIVGGFTLDSGILKFALARYTSSGVLDTTFDLDGIIITQIGNSASLNALGLQSTGEIIAGGLSDNNFALSRYLANGILDNTFGTGGIVTTDISPLDEVQTVTIRQTGEILAGGFFNGNKQGNVVAQYLSNGNLDNSFGINGIYTTEKNAPSQISKLILQTDNTIIATGYSDCGVLVTSLLSDAALDEPFGISGTTTTPLNNVGCASTLVPDVSIFSRFIGSGSSGIVTISPGATQTLAEWSSSAITKFNTGSFDLTTGVFTAPINGKYSIKATVFISTTLNVSLLGVNSPRAQLLHNGTDVILEGKLFTLSILSGLITLSIGEVSIPLNADIELQAGDTLELQVVNPLGINIDISNGTPSQSDLTTISIHRIS